MKSRVHWLLSSSVDLAGLSVSPASIGGELRASEGNQRIHPSIHGVMEQPRYKHVR
jgi:hypothetical protein